MEEVEDLKSELINLQEEINLLEIDLKDEKELVENFKKFNYQLVVGIKIAAEEAYFNTLLHVDIVDRDEWIKTKIDEWRIKAEEIR